MPFPRAARVIWAKLLEGEEPQSPKRIDSRTICNLLTQFVGAMSVTLTCVLPSKVTSESIGLGLDH